MASANALLKPTTPAPAERQRPDILPLQTELLDRAKTQWRFGDWAALAALREAEIAHHPDRANLLALAAAGQFQCGNSTRARELVELAREAGCNRRLLAQILIGNAYDAVGRAALFAHDGNRALRCLGHSVSLSSPGVDATAMVRARVGALVHAQGKLIGARRAALTAADADATDADATDAKDMTGEAAEAAAADTAVDGSARE